MPVNYKNPIQPRDVRNGDWFWINRQVWQDKKLSQSDKVVYGTIAFFANNATQESFPSIETLAQFSSISKRQTYRSIKSLEERGLIKIQRHRVKGKPNEYLLLKVKGDKIAPKRKRVTRSHKKGDTMSQNRVTNSTSNKSIINKTNKQDNIATNGQSTLKPFKRKPEDKRLPLHRLGYYLEDVLHTNIVNWGKQAKAVGMMTRAGFTEMQIKKVIHHMATKDEFFSEKGFDLMTVANNIGRYKAQSKKHGL